MKTKLFISIIVLAMITLVFSLPNVKAANGPSDSYSFIRFSTEEEPISIYNSFGEENQVAEGVSYDKASNTLTLTNFTKEYFLLANMMGDDFKLKLVGENSLSGIVVWGDVYGGSLNIVGEGSLTVNEKKDSVNAIALYAENSNSVLTVADTANVKLYAEEAVVCIVATTANSDSKAIELKNGQNISEKILKNNYTHQEGQLGICYEEELHADYTVYTKDGKKYGLCEQDGKFCVTSSPIVYDEGTTNYFIDRSITINPEDPEEYNWNYNIEFNTIDDVLAAGYVATEEQVTTTWAFGMDALYSVYKDANNKKYVVTENWYNDVVTYKVYEITDRTMVLSDGNQYNFWALSNTVQYEDLTESIIAEDTLFDYTVDLKELIIDASEEQIPEEQKPAEEEKPVEEPETPEIKVEAAEDKAVDNQAAEAVKKLVTDIAEGKEVSGISKELKEQISKALDEGKTITVEVTAPEAKAEEVQEDSKKIEEKLTDNGKIAALYNIEVVVKVDGEVVGKVTETGEELKLVLPVPKNLPAVPEGYTRTFTIYKVHNGVAVALETTLDNDELSAKSSEFSTYAITYEDVKVTNNPATGDMVNLYIILFAISILGMTIVTKYMKRK